MFTQSFLTKSMNFFFRPLGFGIFSQANASCLRYPPNYVDKYITTIVGRTYSMSQSLHTLAFQDNFRAENNRTYNLRGYALTYVRLMNRNARWPKKSNHGKRPCSHARRWAKRKMIKSRAYRKKIFGIY